MKLTCLKRNNYLEHLQILNRFLVLHELKNNSGSEISQIKLLQNITTTSWYINQHQYVFCWYWITSKQNYKANRCDPFTTKFLIALIKNNDDRLDLVIKEMGSKSNWFNSR